jgi:hypothetical protein
MLKSAGHRIQKETADLSIAGPVRLLAFLNKKKKHLNCLIDDFEDLAFRLRKEMSAGIGREKIQAYSNRLNQINDNIISQRGIITELEAEVKKIEVLQQ